MTSFFKRFKGKDGDGNEASATGGGPVGEAPTGPVTWPPEGRLPYGEAKRLARHADPEIRRKLALRGDVPPEILYFLADDVDPKVRRAIVSNGSTPALAHLLLAEDTDDGVRADLAERIVQLAPGLTNDERDRARLTAFRVLERLARDQIPRVRSILSEALKDVADAPPEVINRLARDVEEAVSTPILEFSPVLRDEDLLDIIGESPTTATLSAISRRARVAADVADAIAATDDSVAITALLSNASAQIREETLDDLIERAENQPQWHEPLVRRPQLRKEAASRLARFVADRLIQVLLERRDLSPETLGEVKRVVHRRLEEEGRSQSDLGRFVASSGAGGATVVRPPPVIKADLKVLPAIVADAYRRAQMMHRRGTLTQAVVQQALKAGDAEFVSGAMAVLAAVPLPAVLHAVETQSGRAIAALAWRAGLPPVLSVQVQARLARIPPREVISAAGDHAYGLTEAEMEWQIELVTKHAAHRADMPEETEDGTGKG